MTAHAGESMAGPAITARRCTVLSPWVSVMERAVTAPGGTPALFHSLRLADYVSVLARTGAGEVILVRQFRPTWESLTLELPGGLLEAGEAPEMCARRELEEEAGFRMTRPPVPLGPGLITDTGRLENRLWGFFADRVEPAPGWRPEAEVEPVLIPVPAFLETVRDGRFDHALHVALVGLAVMRGLI